MFNLLLTLALATAPNVKPAVNTTCPVLGEKVTANLPTSPHNAKDALQFNVKFWADQGEELEKRFASWATN